MKKSVSQDLHVRSNIKKISFVVIIISVLALLIVLWRFY